MGDLSKHFSMYEFACSCGCGYGMHPNEVSPKLIDGLEILRAKLCRKFDRDVPIEVTSGCRCHSKNRSITGSHPNSHHLRGVAADIVAAGVSPFVVAGLAKSIDVFERGGIGTAYNFTHLDVRGHKARWSY